MKRILLALFMLTYLSSFSQDGKVQAIFDYKQFSTPYGATYIETYLSFIASSLHYATNKNGVLQSNILVTQIFKQGDEIIDFKKFEVLGPELIDSVAVGFSDQKRYQLNPGSYHMELEVMDLNDPDSTSLISHQLIRISENNDAVSISDIELVDYYKRTIRKNNFSKSGYDLYPLVSTYISTDIEKLAYYFELYKKDTLEEPFLLTQYIKNHDNDEILSRFIKRDRIQLKGIKPQLNVFNIKKLVSGNYDLVVELKDKKNRVVFSKSLFFQRINKSYRNEEEVTNTVSFESVITADSVDIFLSYLTPIATEMEKSVITTKTKGMTDQMKMNYFYNFWSRRNPTNPKQAWLDHKALTIAIDKKYGSRKLRGYDTDMGRVELKYGEPNTQVRRPSNNGQFPYEIWQYYNVNNQNNVVFVFYQPQLVQQSYELLHSDLAGEIKNRNWRQFLNVNPSVIDNSGLDIETGR